MLQVGTDPERPDAELFHMAYVAKAADPARRPDELPDFAGASPDADLAHVRAATHGATRRDNCHPFVQGTWSFMHNGQIGDFEKIRRKLEASLGDHLYDQIEGTTDSELFFLLRYKQIICM